MKGTIVVFDRLPHDDVLEVERAKDWVFEISVSRFGHRGREDPPERFQFAHPKFRKPVFVPKTAFGLGKSVIAMVARSSRPISLAEMAGPAEIVSIGPAGNDLDIAWSTSLKRGPILGNLTDVHLDPDQPAGGPWTKQFAANHVTIRYRGELTRISQAPQSNQNTVRARPGLSHASR